MKKLAIGLVLFLATLLPQAVLAGPPPPVALPTAPNPQQLTASLWGVAGIDIAIGGGNQFMVYEADGHIYCGQKGSAIDPVDLGSGTSPVIAAGPDGVPQVIFKNGGNLIYISKTDGVWDTPFTIWTDGVDLYDLAVGSDNKPHVAVSVNNYDADIYNEILHITKGVDGLPQVDLIFDGSSSETSANYYEGQPVIKADAAGYYYIAVVHDTYDSITGDSYAAEIYSSATGTVAASSPSYGNLAFTLAKHSFAVSSDGGFFLLHNGQLGMWDALNGWVNFPIPTGTGHVISVDGTYGFPQIAYIDAGKLYYSYATDPSGFVPGYLMDDDATCRDLSIVALPGSAMLAYEKHDVMSIFNAFISKTGPTASLSATSYDFGTVNVGDYPSTGISVVNTGASDLTVYDIQSNWPFDLDTYSFTGGGNGFPVIIPPGQSKEFFVNFSASDGPFSGTVTVATDDLENQTLTLNVAGTGHTPLAVEVYVYDSNADYLDFDMYTTAKTEGGSVFVELIRDANGNGVVDEGEWAIDAGTIQDNGNSTIKAASNDWDGSSPYIASYFEYRDSLIEPGSYLIRVTAPDGESATAPFEVYPAVNSYLTVSGSVFTDGQGLPVENAVVAIFDDSDYSNHMYSIGYTGADGSFSVSVPDSAYYKNLKIGTMKPGLLQSSGSAFDLSAYLADPVGNLDGINLTLTEPDSTITGNTIEIFRNDQPLGGVSVWAESESGLSVETRTTPDGAFVLPSVTGMNWTVSADPPAGYFQMISENGQDSYTGVQAGDWLLFSGLKSTLSIYGYVYTEDYYSVEGAVIKAQSTDAPFDVHSKGVTDRNGEAYFGATAGNWNLSLSNNKVYIDKGAGRVATEIVPANFYNNEYFQDGDRPEYGFMVYYADCAVEGNVFNDPAKTQAAGNGIRVEATSIRAENFWYDSYWGEVDPITASVQTDANGHFRIPLLKGKWLLRAYNSNGEVTGSRVVTLDADGNDVIDEGEVYFGNDLCFGDNRPIVTGSYPADGTTDVDGGLNTISINFDKQMDIASFSIGSTVKLMRGAVDESYRIQFVNGPEAGLILDTSSRLVPGATYTVILSGVTSLDGGVLDSSSFSFTVASYPPVNESALAADGSTGVPQTVQAVWSDLDGSANLENLTLKMGTVKLMYVQSQNKLYLSNDAVTAWLGGFAPGSVNTVSNSSVTLDASGTTVTQFGNQVTVNFMVTPKTAFSGIKTLYLSASDLQGNKSPVNENKGTWTITTPQFPPVNVSATAAAGTVDVAQDITGVWSDGNGAANIEFATLKTSTAKLVYIQSQNKLYLYDDAGTTMLGGFAPGSVNTVSNSSVTLDASGSTVSLDGDQLTVKFRVTPKAGFTGAKALYMYAYDLEGNKSPVNENKGTWTITVPQFSPVNVSATAAAGTVDTAQDITGVWSDGNGAANLETMTFKMGTVKLQYVQSQNKLYLSNDAVTAWLGGFAPGSANTISNASMTLDVSGTTVTPSGDQLSVKFRVTPKAGFTGAKTLYMSVADLQGNKSPVNETKGTWTVTVPQFSPVNVSATAAAGTVDVAQDITGVWSDGNGAANIEFTTLKTSTAKLVYIQSKNKLYLYDDAGTAMLGGF
ncbi:MAG TPA: hypothetical protein VGK71_09855, partial [Nitrospirota bacterium]